MTSLDPERPELEPGDARFVARLRASFAPAPLSPAQRLAFDARLEERLERRHRHVLARAVGLGFAGALAVAVVLVRHAAPPSGEPPAGAAARAERDAFAADLLYGEPADYRDDEEALPPQYAAIAGAFLTRGSDAEE